MTTSLLWLQTWIGLQFSRSQLALNAGGISAKDLGVNGWRALSNFTLQQKANNGRSWSTLINKCLIVFPRSSKQTAGLIPNVYDTTVHKTFDYRRRVTPFVVAFWDQKQRDGPFNKLFQNFDGEECPNLFESIVARPYFFDNLRTSVHIILIAQSRKLNK